MSNATEQAEYLTRRRARVMPFLFIVLASQQVAFVGGNDGSGPGHVKVAAWLIMSVSLLLLLLTGGGLARSKEVRALLNDETTRTHRARALSIGFVTTMATGIGLYALSLFTNLPGRSAVHVMMTAGIGAALIAFTVLERRALR